MKSISTPHPNNVSLTIGTKLNDHPALVNAYFILPQELNQWATISCVLKHLFSSFYFEDDCMRFEPHDYEMTVEISKHTKGYIVRSGIKSTKTDSQEPIINALHTRVDTISDFYLRIVDE